MYDSHYGLTGRPFQLTPDPEFWFETATHRKAMAYLGYGLSQGEGFIVITGEPGAGKTTLVGHVMGQIDAERLHVIKIVTTQVAADDLIRMVAQGLGVNATGLAKADLLAAIERGLHAVARTGKRTLLIVDEAQSLLVGSLEELRMLSNFQLGGHPLLQIFLLGQPEFRLLLQGSDKLEQLRQRVIAMHHLDPMGVEEVEAYLAHRLGVVGWNGRPHFGPDAIAEMHRWSDGIPRKLNQIANRVMLFGAIEGIEDFTGEDVAQVVSDIDGDMHSAARDGTMPSWVDDSALVAAVAEEPAAAEPMLDHAAFAAQLAGIEARLTEQDRALRRVLTLLVDWVENDQRRHDYQSDAA